MGVQISDQSKYNPISNRTTNCAVSSKICLPIDMMKRGLLKWRNECKDTNRVQ